MKKSIFIFFLFILFFLCSLFFVSAMGVGLDITLTIEISNEEPECEDDYDCNYNEYCKNSDCIQLVCDNDEKIKNHECVKEDKKNECKSHDYCDFDEICFNERCVTLQCASDEYAYNHSCLKREIKDSENKETEQSTTKFTSSKKEVMYLYPAIQKKRFFETPLFFLILIYGGLTGAFIFIFAIAISIIK